jgi:hypothetical protein
MKLNNILSIKRIESRRRRPSDTYRNLIFGYKEYNLNLHVGFDITSFTLDMIPISNFGYGLDISKFNNRTDSFNYLDIDDSDGKSTKKYFDDKESRSIVNKFIHKSIYKDIRDFKFPLLVRGPLSTFKQNSQRYLDIDDIIFKFGYNKVIIKASEMNNHLPCKHAMKDIDTDVYWFYTKNNIERYELCNLFEN